VAELAADLAGFSPDAGPRSAERISRVLSSSGVSSPGLSSSNLTARTAGSSTGAAWGNTQTSRGSRAVWFGMVGVGAAAVIGVVLWKVTNQHPVAPPDVSAAAAVNRPPSEPEVSPPSPMLPVVPPTPVASPPPSATTPAAAPSAAAAPRAPRPISGKPKPTADGKPKPAGDPSVDPLSERN
jgi:hypothetical protein